MADAPVEQIKQEENEWQVAGFLEELAKVCDNLEHLEDTHYLPSDLRTVLELVTNAERVEEFDHLSNEELASYLEIIRRDLPQYHKEILATIRDLSRTRAIIVDNDFI